MERVISVLEGFSFSSGKSHLINCSVGLWPCDPGTRLEASRDLPCGLVIQENLAPLCEKLLMELVTWGMDPLWPWQVRKWGSNQMENQRQGSEAWQKDLKKEGVHPGAGVFHDQLQLATASDMVFLLCALGALSSRAYRGCPSCPGVTATPPVDWLWQHS